MLIVSTMIFNANLVTSTIVETIESTDDISAIGIPIDTTKNLGVFV